MITDVCRLIDRTRDLAQDRQKAESMSRELRRASACVELALEAIEQLESTSSSPAPGWRGERTAALAQRLAGSVEVSENSLKDSGDWGRGEGFVGSSAVIPLPELLGFLKAQGKTGRLRVKLDDELIHLHLRDGDLAHAQSNSSPPGMRLGEILVEQGALEPWLLEKVLADVAEDASGGTVQARVEKLATREQLRTARFCQIQHLFHRLFMAPRALFSFQENKRREEPEGGLMNLLQLLLESARFQDESNCAVAPTEPNWLPGEPAAGAFGGWLFGSDSAEDSEA